MKKRVAKIIRQRKRKIAERIDRNSYPTHHGPVLNIPNIEYDLSERDRGMAYGGIGLIQKMVKQLQLGADHQSERPRVQNSQSVL